METLGKIFGSDSKVKIMRLFLFNPGKVFEVADVAKRADSSREATKRELAVLKNAGMIKNKIFVRVATSKVLKGKIRLAKKKVIGWFLNERFTYMKELQNLLINTILVREEDLVDRLAQAGR